MKIDVIDCRGFVKTPPYNPYSGESLSGRNACRDLISGQVEKDRLTVSVYPLKPSTK